jgi:hypothetical protein
MANSFFEILDCKNNRLFSELGFLRDQPIIFEEIIPESITLSEVIPFLNILLVFTN